METANNLALMLRSGALPAKLNTIEQRTVGAELGADSVHAGELAGVIAVGLIAVFMILAYGFTFGGIAIVVLIANMAIVMGAMSPNPIFGGVTLTLPGIAGLILTIAMAVDANVLIFERIRDEERAGTTSRPWPSTPALPARRNRSWTPTSPHSSPPSSCSCSPAAADVR